MGNFYDLHLGPWKSYLQQDYGEELEYHYYPMSNTMDDPNQIIDNPNQIMDNPVLPIDRYSPHRVLYQQPELRRCERSIVFSKDRESQGKRHLSGTRFNASINQHQHRTCRCLGGD
jgi:hypothetical protein